MPKKMKDIRKTFVSGLKKQIDKLKDLRAGAVKSVRKPYEKARKKQQKYSKAA